MKRNKKFTKHFDLSHSIMFNEYPYIYTKTIGVPGEFVKKINRRVHLKDGTGGEMDSAYIAKPDNKILFEPVAVGLEHQSKPVDPFKLNKFGDYDIQMVSDENLPTLLAVASHLNPEKSENELIRSPSDITQLYFLNLGKENICQRLNRVKEIINNNEKLGDEDALNLGVILLYAPREHAYEITETIVDLYLKVLPDLDFKMESCLYSVMIILIDAFIDDENDYRRLTNMIEDNKTEEVEPLFETKKALIESLHWTEEDLAKANNTLTEKQKQLEKANGNLAKKTEQLEKANGNLAKKTEQLEKANGNLAEADAIIIRLKKENQMLKAQLNSK